ncbi:hypothetical protein J3A83DRAFT_4400147 [Scleroderma citrinum]
MELSRYSDKVSGRWVPRIRHSIHGDWDSCVETHHIMLYIMLFMAGRTDRFRDIPHQEETNKHTSVEGKRKRRRLSSAASLHSEEGRTHNRISKAEPSNAKTPDDEDDELGESDYNAGHVIPGLPPSAAVISQTPRPIEVEEISWLVSTVLYQWYGYIYSSSASSEEQAGTLPNWLMTTFFTLEADHPLRAQMFPSKTTSDPVFGLASQEVFSAPQEERVFAFSPPAENASSNTLANTWALPTSHDFGSSPIPDSPVAQPAEMLASSRYSALPDLTHGPEEAVDKLHRDVPAWHDAAVSGVRIQHKHFRETPKLLKSREDFSASSDTSNSYLLATSGCSAITQSYCCPPVLSSCINPECWTPQALNHSEVPAVYATPGPTFACSHSCFESDTPSPGAVTNIKEAILLQHKDPAHFGQASLLSSFEENSPSNVFDSQAPVNTASLDYNTGSVCPSPGPRYQRDLSVNTHLAHAQAIRHSAFFLTLETFASVLHNPSFASDGAKCTMNKGRWNHPLSRLLTPPYLKQPLLDFTPRLPWKPR